MNNLVFNVFVCILVQVGLWIPCQPPSLGNNKRPWRYNGFTFYKQMISIERCQQILKSNNFSLANEVVKDVREYLYFLATLEIEVNNNADRTNGNDQSLAIL